MNTTRRLCARSFTFSAAGLLLAAVLTGCAPDPKDTGVLGEVLENPDGTTDPNEPVDVDGDGVPDNIEDAAAGDEPGGQDGGDVAGEGGDGQDGDGNVPSVGPGDSYAGVAGVFRTDATRLDFGSTLKEMWLTVEADPAIPYTLTTSAAWATAEVVQKATVIGDRVRVTLNRTGLSNGAYFGVLRMKRSANEEILILLFMAVTGPLPAPPGAPSFQGLGDADVIGFDSRVTAIAPDGSVIVGRGDPAHLPYVVGMHWTSPPAGGSLLGDLPGGGVFGTLLGASNGGAVLVGQGQSLNGLEAFSREADGLRPLGDLPGGDFCSAALAVSADGSTVVGYGTNSWGLSAMRWSKSGGIADLGNLPGGSMGSCALAVSADGSVIAGYASSQAGRHACRWTSSGIEPLSGLSGGEYAEARAVSSDGVFIAGQSDSEQGPQAFRWSAAGGAQALGDLPGGEFYSCANAISADGRRVIGTSESGAGMEAFVWNEGDALVRLQDWLASAYGLNTTGWKLTSAQGMSRDGRVIVGRGINPAGNMESWVVRLP